MAEPLRGGGIKGRAIEEKKTFFDTFFSLFHPFSGPATEKRSFVRQKAQQGLIARHPSWSTPF